MQIAAIPTGPTYYQPIAAVPAVKPVTRQASDDDTVAAKVRAAPPAGMGSLLDIEA